MTARRDSFDQQLGATLDEVREVYRELATRPVQRSCELRTECCRFRLTGLTPYLTRGEAIVAATALRATGCTSVSLRDDGACPLLGDEGRCRIYEARPFGCRTHFCQAAGGMIPRRQVLGLIRRLEIVDGQLGGDGPKALPVALQQAMASLGGRSGRSGRSTRARQRGTQASFSR